MLMKAHHKHLENKLTPKNQSKLKWHTTCSIITQLKISSFRLEWEQRACLNRWTENWVIWTSLSISSDKWEFSMWCLYHHSLLFKLCCLLHYGQKTTAKPWSLTGCLKQQLQQLPSILSILYFWNYLLWIEKKISWQFCKNSVLYLSLLDTFGRSRTPLNRPGCEAGSSAKWKK